jgi:hypothetical protein
MELLSILGLLEVQPLEAHILSGPFLIRLAKQGSKTHYISVPLFSISPEILIGSPSCHSIPRRKYVKFISGPVSASFLLHPNCSSKAAHCDI